MNRNHIFALVIIGLVLIVGVEAAVEGHLASEILAGVFGKGDFTIHNEGEVFLAIKNNGTGGVEYKLVSASGGGGIGAGKFSIFDSKADISRLTVDSSGNVGIGTTTPTSKLEIAGDLKATGSIQIGSVSSLPNDCNVPGNSGKLVFNTVVNKPFVCDGTNWRELTAGGVDNDGDGFPSFATGGTDCVDSDANIKPSSGVTCNYGVTCSLPPPDDPACGSIDCDGLDVACRNYNDLTSNRCEGYDDCKDPNGADCTSYIDTPAGIKTGLCQECNGGGGQRTASDDPACGTIDCDGLDTACKDYDDIVSNRCEGSGNCKDPNSGDCTSFAPASQGTVCGTCKICDGAGGCGNSPLGTSCGTNQACDGNGNCGSTCKPTKTCTKSGTGHLIATSALGPACAAYCGSCSGGVSIGNQVFSSSGTYLLFNFDSCSESAATGPNTQAACYRNGGGLCPTGFENNFIWCSCSP